MDTPDAGRPIEQTFGIINVMDRPYLVFGDGMLPADLVTHIDRRGDVIEVGYNAGGVEFRREYRPIHRPE